MSDTRTSKERDLSEYLGKDREELRSILGERDAEIERLQEQLRGCSRELAIERRAAQRASNEPPAEQLPSAWIKGHTLHTDAGIEYDEEVVPGSDRPKGEGWHPLYSRPSQPPGDAADVCRRIFLSATGACEPMTLADVQNLTRPYATPTKEV
ncbi:MAG TPA: hypothetical protein VGD45_20260 [Steroidobacter sp.]|uniref:hypothetical protein n=1 Tax=Steroidobacter sp. TaxID=1978227 RepID=UPI002EDB05D4